MDKRLTPSGFYYSEGDFTFRDFLENGVEDTKEMAGVEDAKEMTGVEDTKEMTGVEDENKDTTEINSEGRGQTLETGEEIVVKPSEQLVKHAA